LKKNSTISISEINAQLLQSNVSAIKMQIHVTISSALENMSTQNKNGIARRIATPQTIGSPRGFNRRYLKKRKLLYSYLFK